MHNIIIVILILVPVALGFIWLDRASKKIYNRLKEFRKQAFNAENLTELEDVQVALKVFCSEKCWHLNQHEYANKIRDYIRGRIDEIERRK